MVFRPRGFLFVYAGAVRERGLEHDEIVVPAELLGSDSWVVGAPEFRRRCGLVSLWSGWGRVTSACREGAVWLVSITYGELT